MRIGLNVQLLSKWIRELRATHDANFPDEPLIVDPREVMLDEI